MFEHYPEINMMPEVSTITPAARRRLADTASGTIRDEPEGFELRTVLQSAPLLDVAEPLPAYVET